MIENASAKSASWITTGGGGLPVFNSQAFSKKDSKICKNRPNLVLNVPPEEDEKEVKISRTPLVLKYLKNNWIWHNKNGMEKDAASTSRKKKDYASRAYDREVRRRMRHIRTPDPEQLEAEVQPREPSPGLLEFIASSEAQQGSNNSLGVGQERSQIRQRRMHSDFLIRELESQQQDGITGNSVLVSQEQPVEVEHMDMEQQPKAGIQSMAARAMEVEEDSLNTAISTDASSSTSASMPTTSAAVFANKRRTRRTNNAEQMRHANANVNDDDIESANVEQEMPPKKIVRTNQQN